MWYVIQTITGKEQETVNAIDRVLNKNSYESCFVIRRECVWRIEGSYRVHIERIFPSYVFVETDTPEEFFHALKRVPKLTKLLGNEGIFWPVRKEDETFLQKLTENSPEHLIRRSLVEINEEGDIITADGVLKEYIGKIVRKRLRKRVVVVEIPFLGQTRQLELGIRLAGDEK